MKRYILFTCAVLLSAIVSPKAQSSCYFDASIAHPAGIYYDGTYIWATSTTGNYVVKINPSTCTVVGDYAVGNFPIDIAFDGTNIWVTNYDSNTVSELSESTGATIGTYPVGSNPRGIVYGRDGNIWVANYSSNTVTKINPSNGEVLGNYAVGSGPYFMQPTTTGVWVANRNSNNVMLVAANGTIALTVATDSEPQFITFDGSNIWVSCYSSETVDKINATTGTLLASIEVSAHGAPTGLSWNQPAGTIWGCTWGGWLFYINYQTDEVTYENIGLTDNLYDITLIDNTSFWVSDISGNQVFN